MQWTASKIREQFLTYFEQKEHQIVDSAPMVVKGDPTLMFINAGMNQFKDVFLNNAQAKSERVTDTQKCLRVSGKHNDLEEVGVDTYHHTMFEMLGNWSFGNYFKEEAIEWAWDLLTNVYGIDKDRIYVTIFEGDPSEGTKLDLEAKEFWTKWISQDRILPFGKKDNFWEMGDTGPCGPCSEIHVDIRSEEERAATDGKTLVNQDHPQVIEIWNLVFIQYNRLASGKLELLKSSHVDTGMGFERLAMVLQGKTSNYDTDVFSPLIDALVNRSGIEYKATQSKSDVANRVIVDHIRAISFAIADGQLPSNTGAGYVIRRILRRAVRYGYSFLDLKEPFLFQLVDTLVHQMGHQFNELKRQQELIEKVIREEEDGFLRTLQRGIQLFNEYKKNHHQVKGDFAFELYDTYGFPIDLTQLLAAESQMSVDLVGFNKALDIQKERSRKATTQKAGDWVILKEDEKEEFIGYDYTSSEVSITRYRKVEAKGKQIYQFIFNLTPFYPEGGGQVGDKGFIEANGEKIDIYDTKKENNVIIHFSKKMPSKPEAVFYAQVHSESRMLATANHTATHLLHEALREVLGTHVEQKGSLVKPDYLRFDFSHYEKIESDSLKQVERLVNHRIRKNLPLKEERAIPLAKAQEMGALMLFGEKYGDVVRVIQFGDSKELCGGTHVKATGDLGLFKITSESGSAAGIRRIEAITSVAAENYVDKQEQLINDLRKLLKNNNDITKAVQGLLSENESLNQKMHLVQLQKEKELKNELVEKAIRIGDVEFIAAQVEVEPASAKNIIFQMKSELENGVILLGSGGEKATLSLFIDETLVKSKGWNAGKIIRGLAAHIQGGGGGQPFFATAGGKKSEGIDAAFAEMKQIIEG